MASSGRKRGAHKGVVRKRIAELGDVIKVAEEAGEERPDLDALKRLRQLRQNLQEKVEIIGKLDEEILNGIDDEEKLMKDIEEADAFRQEIYDAIIQVDAVLSRSVEPKFNERGSAHRSTPIRPKLPELTLNKFEGDITTWTSFWDAYESAVHNNAALSDVDKFTYLKSLVGRSAKDAIEGLPLTVANYKEAVSSDSAINN